MSHMELFTTQKGALYSCECAKCGATLYSHEWAHVDHNERRDAMENGTLPCDQCNGRADPETFGQCKPGGYNIGGNLRKWYACRYSAPGYLDCTDWSYGTNRRKLEKEVRDFYNGN
jgi:hypothetical protein